MKNNLHLIAELPYRPDSTDLFCQWSNEPWAVLLDSAYPHSHLGRYDIFAARPSKTLITRGPLTEIRDRHNVRLSPDDPFQLLKQALEPELPEVPGIPFNGGAIGYFSYDLARRLENIPNLATVEEKIPEMMVAIYDWACVVDHQLQCCWLIGRSKPEVVEIWPQLIKNISQPRPSLSGSFYLRGELTSNLTWETYAAAFERIQHYIREGDCYQVNFSQRFAAHGGGDPWSVYLALRHLNPAPFSGYLNFPHVTVMSSSPERFLQVRSGQVETKPIKGTRPRSGNPEADLYQIEALSESLKDRAENLMIVDLLRNDLSKNCKLGSVRVPKLFEVESFATVHHLVSTVVGELEIGRHPLDLLRGCFPGGSITGAPKIRAMEIIEELEPVRRGIYCGAIGYVGFDGSMDTNIAIRTLVYSGHCMRFWAGGGIIADSDARREYQESYDKAAALIQVLSQFGLKAADYVGR